MRVRYLLPIALSSCIAGSCLAQPPHVGYQDTPLLPGGKWHVHDGNRPQPKVIDSGNSSKAPSDATILFNGRGLGQWHGENGAAKWVARKSYFEVAPGTGPITTNGEFGDFQLHIEFCSPNPPRGRDQDCGNSGVFLFGRYEIQVLDNFGNITYPDGQAGAIYGQYPPEVNASRRPGQWQTYDIIFNAPRFDGDRLVTPAYATVIHNGVLVQNHRALLGPTQHRALAHYTPHPLRGPIQLQDHGHPVRYRNVWIREIGPYESDN